MLRTLGSNKGENIMWYTLQTRPNYEAKVTLEIEKKIKEYNLPIREIFSPTETIIDYKNGQKKERVKRTYTNYLFVDMDFADSVWHVLKGVKGVVGFVGNRAQPLAILDSEIATMKERASSAVPKPKMLFRTGTKIRIASGSFKDFYGVMKSVDYEKNRAKVAVNIFNRETEIEIELTALEVAS